MIESGLEVEAFREAMCECSSIGCRVRVDLIGRECELEISEILLMVDPGGVCVWGGGGGGGGGSHLIECRCTVTSRRVGCVKLRKNPIFSKKGKIVNSVKIRIFSRSWMTKWISLLESSREI